MLQVREKRLDLCRDKYTGTTFPLQKGLSERSVRSFCKLHGLTKMDDVEVDEVVEQAVEEVQNES